MNLWIWLICEPMYCAEGHWYRPLCFVGKSYDHWLRVSLQGCVHWFAVNTTYVCASGQVYGHRSAVVSISYLKQTKQMQVQLPGLKGRIWGKVVIGRSCLSNQRIDPTAGLFFYLSVSTGMSSHSLGTLGRSLSSRCCQFTWWYHLSHYC